MDRIHTYIHKHMGYLLKTGCSGNDILQILIMICENFFIAWSKFGAGSRGPGVGGRCSVAGGPEGWEPGAVGRRAGGRWLGAEDQQHRPVSFGKRIFDYAVYAIRHIFEKSVHVSMSTHLMTTKEEVRNSQYTYPKQRTIKRREVVSPYKIT